MSATSTTTIARDGGPILVIDIGGTNVKFGYSVDGVPLDYRRLLPTAGLRDPEPIRKLARMIRSVVAETGIHPGVVVSTVPGLIDKDGDRILYAGNIPELNQRRLATELSAETGCPVLLERDAILTLLGEMAGGIARDSTAALGVFFGTGVGAAYVQDGKPFRGFGWALEIGHIPFGRAGRTLEGVRTDSLETYVSGRLLQDMADRHGANVADIFREARTRPALQQELDNFVHDQAIAIGTAVALFSPQTIVLGGGVLEIPDFPRERLRSLLEVNAPFTETSLAMDVRWAALGWRSALHGAAHVVRGRIPSNGYPAVNAG